jgi:hypothetical protein
MGAGDDKGGSSGALRVPDPSHPGSFHNLKHVDHLTHHTSVSGSAWRGLHVCSSGRAEFFSVVAHNTRRLPPLSTIPHSWPRLPALAHLLMPHDSNALLPCSSPTRSCAVFAPTFQKRFFFLFADNFLCFLPLPSMGSTHAHARVIVNCVLSRRRCFQRSQAGAHPRMSC